MLSRFSTHRKITSDSADGDTCLAEIDGASERLKIVPSQRLTYCFDGEACYQGEPKPYVSGHSLGQRGPSATQECINLGDRFW